MQGSIFEVMYGGANEQDAGKAVPDWPTRTGHFSPRNAFALEFEHHGRNFILPLSRLHGLGHQIRPPRSIMLDTGSRFRASATGLLLPPSGKGTHQLSRVL